MIIFVTYSFGVLVEPLRNVRAGSEHDRVTQGTSVVLVDEQSQVEDLVEEGDPALISSVVLCDLCRSVKVAKFVRSGNVFRFVDLGWLGLAGGGNSRSHI